MKDLTGRTFNRWTVLRLSHHQKVSGNTTRFFWNCRCDCGTVRVVNGNNLTTGISKSCGCWKSEVTTRRSLKHGRCRFPEFHVWQMMKGRCENPKVAHFDSYGGRGIKVCERWQTFENFLTDMGSRPTPMHTLERRDNDGPYSPENCVWATRREQGNNRRTNRLLTYNGQTRTLTEWARHLGVSPSLITSRLTYGWTVERALTEPNHRF